MKIKNKLLLLFILLFSGAIYGQNEQFKVLDRFGNEYNDINLGGQEISNILNIVSDGHVMKNRVVKLS